MAIVDFAAFVSELSKLIDNSVNVISKLTGQIKTAIDDSASIYDGHKLRVLRGVIDGIRGRMVAVNGAKLENLNALLDYVNHDAFAMRWTEYKANCSKVVIALEDLLSSIGVEESRLSNVMTVENASDLHGALQRQKDVYKKISEFPKPETPENFEVFKNAVKKLKDLYDEVIKLESNLDAYIRKFPATSRG